jgi:hypothetical protein
MSDPVWAKQLSNRFTLMEYPVTPDLPHCSIVGRRESAKSEQISILFKTWGLDRATITSTQCATVFQAVLEVEIIDEMSGFTFCEALAWASD